MILNQLESQTQESNRRHIALQAKLIQLAP
jgi:hypothetical protein